MLGKTTEQGLVLKTKMATNSHNQIKSIVFYKIGTYLGIYLLRKIPMDLYLNQFN